MIEIAPIEELREVRRRLSEAQQDDAERYAAMLRQVSKTLPGKYVSEPLTYSQPVPQPQAVEA